MAARLNLGQPRFDESAPFGQICQLPGKFVGRRQREGGQGALTLDGEVLLQQLWKQHEAVRQDLLGPLDGLGLLVVPRHVEAVDVVAESSNESFDGQDSNR